MLEVLQAGGAILYAIDETARLEEYSRFVSAFPGVPPALVPETMSDQGNGIRDGQMYAPRLMKRLGPSPDTGVNRASLVHYNSLHEIHEFGKVLLDIVPVDRQATSARVPMAFRLAGNPEGLEFSIPCFMLLLLLVSVFYWALNGREPQQTGGADLNAISSLPG
jgi:hypothetical protein